MSERGPTPRVMVFDGLAGALVVHFSCYMLFWVFSFGPTLTEVLVHTFLIAVGPIILGVCIGLLCARYRVPQSFLVASAAVFIATVIANFAPEYPGVPMSTSYVLKDIVVYSIALFVSGFAVALLLVGLIVAVRRATQRGTSDADPE